MFRQCLFGLVVPRDSVQIRGVALYVLLDFENCKRGFIFGINRKNYMNFYISILHRFEYIYLETKKKTKPNIIYK